MNNKENCTYYTSLIKDPRYIHRRFWTFRHKPGAQANESDALKYVLEAYREGVCKMQYEYDHQDRKSVTANWNMVKQIKEGDVVFLRGDSLLYAVGVVQPHQITEAAVTSMQDCISHGRHGENGDLESSSYNGKVIFKDSDVFFEDLSGGEDGWGQRIKIDHWSFFCRTGISCKDDKYYIGSPYPAIRELKPEAVSHLISNLFESYQKEFPMIYKLRSLVEQNKNVVLTGAPGTGKTFVAQQVAQLMILGRVPDTECPLTEHESKQLSVQLQFCQFHPSMDYTDFVEGLRPIRVGGNPSSIGFERKDGMFKVLCKRAVEGAEVGRVDNFSEAWPKLIAMLNDNERISVPLISGRNQFPISLNEYGNGLASRTYDKAGKDWIRGQSKFFTKEQVYNVYLGKPGVPSGGHDNYRKAIVKFMYEHCQLEAFQAGKCDMDQSASQQPYVMIIDEINRGDISKIFGELFYAIDKGYRGKSGSVKTQYQNLVEENDPFFDGFYVPGNVYIIGTMNDIDRGVESMDFAIRRRFAWEEIKPEDRFDAMMSGLKDSSGTAVPEEIVKQAKEHMDGLNSAIRDKKHGLGSAYQIGPSYFMRIADYTGDANERFDSLWTHHLEPLLKEYLRGMPNAADTIVKLKSAYDHGMADNTDNVQAGTESAE